MIIINPFILTLNLYFTSMTASSSPDDRKGKQAVWAKWSKLNKKQRNMSLKEKLV